MAISLQCPRCKKPLSIADEQAGSYAHCSHCNGRFWVPDRPPAASSSQIPPPPPGSTVPPPAPAPPGAPPPPASPTPPKPWDASPGHKTARFIAAEVAQSKLKIAEDGKLPELHLQEGQKKQQAADKTTVNPLVLFGAIATSVVLSIFLVLYDSDSEDSAIRQKKQQARDEIERNYFADQVHYANPENAPPLKPYQRHLREAQRAFQRGDFQTERGMYRRVLDLLRSERREGKFEGITGSPKKDETLKEQILILLNEGP